MIRRLGLGCRLVAACLAGASLVACTPPMLGMLGQGGPEPAAPTSTPKYELFAFTSATSLKVGETLSLSAQTNLGPVSYSVDPADADRASLSGSTLTGLSPGPLRVVAEAGGKRFVSLMAVVSPELRQLPPLSGGNSLGSYLFKDRDELDSIPFDAEISDPDLAGHSVLLYTHWYPYDIVGSHLDTSGTPATLSIVTTAQDSAGTGCGCDGPNQTERFLLPSGLTQVVVSNYSWGLPSRNPGLNVNAAMARRAPFGLPGVIISASYSPKPMVFGQPFTLSGRVLGSPDRLPRTLVLSLYGGIWGVNQAHIIELATFSVENRAFSYSGTLPPLVSDASDSFEVVPEKHDGPGKHGYSLFLGDRSSSAFWQDQVIWNLP